MQFVVTGAVTGGFRSWRVSVPVAQRPPRTLASNAVKMRVRRDAIGWQRTQWRCHGSAEPESQR
jgi:hypothetical protein